MSSYDPSQQEASGQTLLSHHHQDLPSCLPRILLGWGRTPVTSGWGGVLLSMYPSCCTDPLVHGESTGSSQSVGLCLLTTPAAVPQLQVQALQGQSPGPDPAIPHSSLVPTSATAFCVYCVMSRTAVKFSKRET